MPGFTNARRWVPVLFFGFYLLIGLLIFDDYGISWDEHLERNHGLVSLDYINEKLGYPLGQDRFSEKYQLLSYRDRDHGHTFSIVSYAVERALNLTDPRDYFLLRHLLTFLLFWSSTIFFFKTADRHFQSWPLALLLTLMIIVSPRIFAHSFYNAKDSIFLSLFIFCMYTAQRFFYKAGWKRALSHGIATALLISMRVLGVIIPVITLGFFLMECLSAACRQNFVSNRLIPLGIYLISTVAFTIGVWPFLWEAPLSNFVFVFNSLSNYDWGGLALYYNHQYKATELPWHYTLGWIFITTPLAYILLFLTGTLVAMQERIHHFIAKRNFFAEEEGRGRLLWLALFFSPLAAVIFLGSTLYDGWRQMFFIYPAFILLSGEGLRYLLRRLTSAGKIIVGLLLGLSIMGTAVQMIWIHPHQYAYFSVVAGSSLDRRFEQDYWGLSNRQSLEYLLQYDRNGMIKLHATNWSGIANRDIIPAAQRQRLQYVSYENADYIISNHRNWKYYDKFIKGEAPFDKPLYEVKVNGNVLSGIYFTERDINHK